MPLVPMREMLQTAQTGGYAVGYFEAWDQYSLEAVLEAGEACRAPVILGFGGVMMNQDWFGNGGLHRLAAQGRAAAEDARVPVSLLLNEVLSFQHVLDGLAWGFNAVMLDSSHRPFEENVTATRRVVTAAHAAGADVEGEFNRLPDASGALGGPAEPEYTDPDEAIAYVEATGIDVLAVAIGNVHILEGDDAPVDCAHLVRLQQAVRLPFSVHGGTSFPDSMVPQAIELGVAKFNVGTIMKRIFLEEIKRAASGLPDVLDIQETVGSRKAGDLLQGAKNAVKDEVMRRMAVYGCVGKG